MSGIAQEPQTDDQVMIEELKIVIHQMQQDMLAMLSRIRFLEQSERNRRSMP